MANVGCNQCSGEWEDDDVTIVEIVDIDTVLKGREEVKFHCPTCGIDVIFQRDKAT